MKPAMRNFWALVVALIALFSILYMIGDALGWTAPEVVEAWLLEQGTAGRFTLAGAIAGLLAIDLLLPVPSSIVMVLAGRLLGVVLGTLSSFTGAMLAALIGFGACRWQGERALRRLVDAQQAQAISQWFERYGVYAIILSRPIPMLTEILSCLAGLSHMSVRRFLLASILGTLPLCLLYGYAGSRGGHSSWLAIWLALGIPSLGWLIMRRLHPTSSSPTRT